MCGQVRVGAAQLKQGLEEAARSAQKAQRTAESRAAKAESELQRLRSSIPMQIEAEVASQVDNQLAAAERELYQKQQAFFQQELDQTMRIKVDAVKQEANHRLERVVQQTSEKATKFAEACDLQIETTQAECGQRMGEMEEQVSHLQHVNAELSSQIRMLSSNEDERAQSWKNQEASLMFQLAGDRKGKELVVLQKDQAESKLSTVYITYTIC